MSSTIEIDKERCKGCKKCYSACFVDVFRWDEEEKKPIPAYEEDCVWCYYCEIACKENCINVVPHIPGRVVAPY